jgi:hypothetical protein
MAISAVAAHERAKIAALSRDREPNDPELLTARRNLRAEQLAVHVAREVAKAPPLTDAQRDRIAALLRAGGAVS